MTELSERLRAERVRSGLSQTALAGNDFSPSYISLIEAGRRVPTDGALKVLAERLGTTPDFLRYGDKAPSEERARLEIGFARLALSNGAAEEARDRLLALDLSTIAPRHHADALHALALAYDALGELDKSVSVLEPLLATARAKGRSLESARIATSLVALYHDAGDLNHGIALGEDVLREVEGAGIEGTDEHLRLAATILWSYYERGDLLYATHRAAELVALAESKGSMRGRGSIYWNAALVAEARGAVDEAQRLTERALAYLSEGAASIDVPRLRLHYAWLLLRSDPPEPHAALEHLDIASEALSVLGYEVELAKCEFESGRAHLMLGDPLLAEELAQAGLARLEGRTTLVSCYGHILLGDTFAWRGDLEAARTSYAFAADMLGMMSASRDSAAIWRSLGDRMLEQGDLSGAVTAYDSALREAGIRPTTLPVVAQSASAGGTTTSARGQRP